MAVGGNNDALEMQTLTICDVDVLKKEFDNLHELLLPATEIKFTHKIGEGMCIYEHVEYASSAYSACMSINLYLLLYLDIVLQKRIAIIFAYV